MPLFSAHTPRGDSLRRAAAADPADVLANVPPAGAAARALLRRYRPLRTAGQGTFGAVEICLDARLQRRVAIKRMPLAGGAANQDTQGALGVHAGLNKTRVVRPGEVDAHAAQLADNAPGPAAAGDPSTPAPLQVETVAAALAEARTASLLQHGHIVSVIDFTFDAAYAYLVMEYVDGMSLAEFLEQVDGHSLTYDEAAAVADALVQALSFAHENGVLHLDVKPANVLIDRNGNVKLTDFGMATLSEAAGFGGARGGTVGYMPPEQIVGAPVDERADTFALAAVLYESLCAQNPFRTSTPAASIEAVRKGPADPVTLLPDLPELADLALLDALSSAPEDRPASIDDFGDRFLEGLGDPRAGRRSLARVIAELTSDDAEDVEARAAAEAERGRRPVELDPAEGWLGSRTPHARAIVAGVLAGLSTAACSARLLDMLGVANPIAQLIVALATGAAAGVAPQLGSALVGAGLVVALVQATDLLPVLPVAVGLVALIASWWYVWGRASIGSSAVFCALLAAGALTGNAVLFAGPLAVVAGYLVSPSAAAATVGLGMLVARLLGAAIADGGNLPVADAAAALVDMHLLAGAAVAAACAAVTSILAGMLWRRVQDGRGRSFEAVVAGAAGIMVVLQLCLANPVENTSSQALPFAAALGVGVVSSIIWFICTYLMGLRKESAEGDRP